MTPAKSVWAMAIGMACLASGIEAADRGLFRQKSDPNVKQASLTQPAGKAGTGQGADRWNEVVATVNGENITRGQLAEELLATNGKKQLDLLINRRIIEQKCREKKIDVTRADIENDVKETVKQLNIKRSEFIERVLGHREMTYAQYVRDVVWPALALKKLAAEKVEVTPEDLQKSFEATYGEKVDVRMLVVTELRKTQELWEKINAVKDPAKRLTMFEEICKTHSIDQATRSFGGRTQPINRHTGFPEIEKLAFDLKPGELSKIIQVPEGNLMLLCVQKVPARTDIQMETPVPNTKETVRDLLTRDLKEKKTRVEVAAMFKDMREKATINDFLTGEFNAEDLKAMNNGVSPASAQKPEEAPPKGN